MSIRAHELADLIEQATVGAIPIEKEYTRRAAGQIRIIGIDAHLDSQGSKSLHSIIQATQQELGKEAINQLNKVEIYGSEYSYINAIPDYDGNIKRIIVFEGLKHLIHYHTCLIKILDRLQVLRPGLKYKLPDGTVVDEGLAFSIAGYSILSEFLISPKQLIAIHEILGPKAQTEVAAAFRRSVCFVLLHELAHIELKHKVRSERLQFSLAEEELLNACKVEELAADKFAMSLIPLESRATFMPSLFFLLGANAFLEVFCGKSNVNHPLAVNRLSLLVDQCEIAPDEKSIYMRWIEGQVGMFRSLEHDRAICEGSILNRIEESIPYDIACKIIIDILYRVGSEYGPLEVEE